MTDETPWPPAPLTVSNDTLLPALTAAGRYILTAGGSFALGKGWIDGDTLQFVTGLAVVLAPAVWGVIKAVTNKRKLIVTAAAAPNSVAVVR